MDVPPPAITRRRFLAWSTAAVAIAGCELVTPSPAPSSSPVGSASDLPTESPPPSPAASVTPSPGAPTATPAGPSARVLYRDGALADGRSDRLRMGVSILVEDGRIRWIRASDAEEDPGPRTGLEVVDASGATFVPGMVDGHAHVTLPGGAHWLERADDPPASLLRVADRNGRLMTGAGVRWARDVGAPYVEDAGAGRRRALNLAVRERWRDGAAYPAYPYLRAAGTWLTRRGTLPNTVHDLEANDADELLAQANRQLDDGADLVKLYLDGPDASASPWSPNEVARVVRAVHARGARVTAHAGRIAGARAGVRGGVDAIEHGFQLDAALCRDMAARGTFVVSTLTLLRSFQTFARTTRIPRFTGADARAANDERRERAQESIRLARAAGVKIAAGTDSGGGSLRANHLAWEVDQLVVAGLEPWEALAAATWRGGELLGEPDAGVIREGGPADFFLVHGDPLSEPGALWRVWRVAWAT